MAIHAFYKDFMKTYYLYILASKPNGTLYVGMTNNLQRRIDEHKQGIGSQFTIKHSVNTLVYYEETTDPVSAINREKQIKSWSRKRKIELIQSLNPDWKDLAVN